jgi:hypothetical protein
MKSSAAALVFLLALTGMLQEANGVYPDPSTTYYHYYDGYPTPTKAPIHQNVNHYVPTPAPIHQNVNHYVTVTPAPIYKNANNYGDSTNTIHHDVKPGTYPPDDSHMGMGKGMGKGKGKATTKSKKPKAPKTKSSKGGGPATNAAPRYPTYYPKAPAQTKPVTYPPKTTNKPHSKSSKSPGVKSYHNEGGRPQFSKAVASVLVASILWVAM